MIRSARFDLERLAPRLADYFASRPEVAAAIVFGSVARAKQTRLSDLDVAVLRRSAGGDSADTDYRAALLADLMSLLKTNEIDLVLLEESSPLLTHRILRDGRAVYVADAGALRDLRVRALQRYLDTKPLREVQRKALADRLSQGRFGVPA